MKKETAALPDVSVIIPVYNAGKYLRQTMDYLVQQTLETIEFIFVDDGSSDNSMDILNEYQKKYPEKIFIFSTPNLGPGEARNEGIANARAEYIGFADADDYMEYDMYEKMFEETKKQECDMVYIPYYLVSGGKKRIMGRVSQPITKEQMIFYGEVSFWTKLVRKSLLENMGKIPAMWFEDTAYMLPMFSYAEKIIYLDQPLYYYMKREGSITNSAEDKKTKDTIAAENYALDHCNPEFRQAVAARIADRILFNMGKRWMYSDEFVQHLKAHEKDFIENTILKKYPVRYEKVMNYLEFPERKIPRILFLAEFGQKLNRKVMEEYRKKVFKGQCEVVILNEENCDISCSPKVKEAYEKKQYEYVKYYFVVKNLYEHGGIFLDSGLHLHNSFENVRMFSSFFGFLDLNTFTDRVFGCCKNDKVMRELWRTYEFPEFYEDTFCPVKDRIRNVLVAYGGVALDDQTHLYEYPCAVFDSSIFVLNSQNPRHICAHDFEKNYQDQGYVVIPDSAVYSLTEKKSLDKTDAVIRELDRVTILKNKLLHQRAELRKENKKLKSKMKEMECSTSWKMTEVFRKGGTAVRKFIGK